jgi:hypothetical protein
VATGATGTAATVTVVAGEYSEPTSPQKYRNLTVKVDEPAVTVAELESAPDGAGDDVPPPSARTS